MLILSLSVMERYSYEASNTFLNIATIPISDHPRQEFHWLPYWSSKMHVFDIVFRLQIWAWIEKTKVLWIKQVGRIRCTCRVLCKLPALPHLKPPGSGPWCLRLSCSVPNSSASRGRCSPKLWPRPALCSTPERQERSKTCSTTPAQ